MAIKEAYLNAKQNLLSDKSICKENKNLWKDFFEKEEYALKRRNKLPQLDDSCYKTLYTYVVRFRTVNRWFKNKAWKSLTKQDIKKVYDDLEDDKIKKDNGEPYKDKQTYYNHIIRSKPFKLAGKSEIVEEVMEFYHTSKEGVLIKGISYVDEVKESVEKRMMAERQRIAKKYISEGEGEAQKIMGDKDREVKTVLSEAYRTAKGIEGKADAQATEIYAKAFNNDPQFYQFVRTLQLYEEGVGKDTKLIIGTDNPLFS